MEDIRNRLNKAWFPDEPLSGCENYQVLLDFGYALMNQGKLGDARNLLEQNEYLPKTSYQKARTEYIFAEECKKRDQSDERTNQPSQQSSLGEAAEHYKQAAEAAKQKLDWALFAQLKAMESFVRYGDVPHQFLGAFENARDALTAWCLLPDHDCTDYLKYEFALAEDVGMKAQFVAEDIAAVSALEGAALVLHRLQGRPDVDAQKVANDDLYLYWDWAWLYHTLGHYRLAFTHALKTRRKGKVLVQPINEGRLQFLIASIANDCVEQGEVGGYSRNRLLNVAEGAIYEAYKLTKARGDHQGYALVLLADAKWMGLKRITVDRIAKIEEAEKIAAEIGDQLLLGQVEIAWGDEYAFKNLARHSLKKVELARDRYQKAEQQLTSLEAFNMARQARHRIERLPKRTIQK